ncbi:MAG TPA: NAD-dependent epimerase/dehydratase family protein, partial [Gemmataceae bacterium]|nr:NAD-dependent epimerase/dehydratase family protein [Gemmataceae bacterium]
MKLTTDHDKVSEATIPRPDDLLLITGATGLVGSHVAQRAQELGLRTRALVRPGSDSRVLDEWRVERAEGELTNP